ncbi:8-oxo-dGTP pyrophosphatase MutT (NUDIX family) [Rhabdobacter roseus]|uniref:8-oxo-dGTP pyrophosphatase MutT (NUDIX family) n=1 Tax=Rhabdobacter roseus TaxID=1655419 RepID=A0A840TI74_9BACT|nr:NUDIX domain-containing protein [Rhabdobacter roseus]MBB5283011.1 8-oxo-dGTP pyrophosphatase MutT (NUDIX family) [Rhabdobacter roseus]
MPTTSVQAILPAVAAIIFNDQGGILLQRRRDVGRWGLLSGHVEFGESVEQAILREIWEETGAKAQLTRLIGVYSQPDSQTYTYPHRRVQYVTTYFEAALLSPPRADFANEETQEIRFFAPDALPTDLAQHHPAWLQDALATTTTAFVR